MGLKLASPITKGPASVGLPINIGGQKIESGDIIVADSGGVIVGPHCKKDFFINWFCQVTN